MERKSWLWAMAGMGLLLPGMAQALGLGSLQVLSAPGEPFRAEIAIQSVTPQAASSLSASLAPASAFAMIALPQAPALAHWQFTVRQGSQPAILISSPLPVTQSALHFLVQLDWSGGQLVREYSASGLDSTFSSPGVSTQAPALPAAVPVTAEPVMQPARMPSRIYQGWSRVSRYGPVPVNGSLYDVARSITRSNAVTLDQVMSALVKANPQAFNNANPTYLYAGSMLTVPSLAQVQALPPAQATAWLRGQSNPGSRIPVAAATTVASPAAVSKTIQPVKATTSATASATHLVLSSAPASAVVASAESTSARNTPPAMTPVVLQSENQKLHAEVVSLGQRLTTEEHLLASQGAQLANLSRSGNQSLMNNIPLWISLGGNLLLLILFVWMLRRQQESERRQREVSQRLSTLNSTKTKAAPDVQPPIPSPVEKNEPKPVPVVESAPSPVPPPLPPVAPTPVMTEPAIPPVVAPVLDAQAHEDDPYDAMEIDPIEQADLYLTYGKTDQAIAVMSEALEDKPQRKELYVKLLDMYATLDRRSEYLELAERMRGRFGPNNVAWQKVAAQGALLFPGNALFIGTDAEASAPAEAIKHASETSVAGQAETVTDSSEPEFPESLDFQFAHDKEEVSKEESSAEPVGSFPEEKKSSLFEDIDEQFRLMDQDRDEASGLAQTTEERLPFSFGLSPFEEEAAAAPSPAPEPESEPPHEMPKPFVVEEAAPASEDWDAVGTKLDLAKAYVEMGDSESARDLLEEVSKEGTTTQREEAQKMLEAL